MREAAWLIQVPAGTLRQWVHGRRYPTAQGVRTSPGIVQLERESGGFLTFTNVVEGHVLSSMRRQHGLKLDTIRTAVRYVEKRLGMPHPLAHEVFKTDGVELFVERLGKLVSASGEGQVVLREALELRLRRIEYARDRAIRLFPLLCGDETPRTIVVDPGVAFGRPVISGTSVPVDAIVQRFKAGEAVLDLADDFGISGAQVEEAIRTIVRPAA